jgi:ComF family protein
MKLLLNDFVNLFYPRLCLLCKNPLIENEQQICLDCLHELPRVPCHAHKNDSVSALFAGFPQISEATAFLFFEKDGITQKLIHSFKYYQNKALAEYLGRIAAIELKANGFYAAVDTLIPVPLHRKKEKRRGYNQSEYIANGIAAIYGCKTDNTSIIRVTDTESQTRKPVYERFANVEKIFRLTDTAQLSGKHVLLVDDVLTTGATLLACMDTLSEIPGMNISVFSLAITGEY